MTDLKRLIDEVDGNLARAVLSSGRSHSPNPARKKQVLTALGVGLVITTTNKLSFAALSTWQKVMFVGGVACVGAGGAMTYTHWLAQPDVVAAPAVAQPVAISAQDEVERSPRQEQATPRADVSTSPTSAAPPIVRQPSNTRLPSERSSVKAELALLEQVRSSLRQGNPSAALQTLSRYGQRHPRGNMRLEAEVLRVESLAAAGRTSEAARLAERVLAGNPKSVVAGRLRRFASKD